MKCFSFSFFWGFFQWFYKGKDDCGFSQFPTFGLQAWKQTYVYIIRTIYARFYNLQREFSWFLQPADDVFCRFYFDFSMTYIGTGMICSHIVNLSLLLGAVLSYGIMWPLIRNLEGEWFPADLPESSMKSLNGYKVSFFFYVF